MTQRADPCELLEKMDQPCSYEVLNGCLRDIARVNRLTGAYGPTLAWLDELVARWPAADKPLNILDVGCGYGDALRRVEAWATERGISVRLTGIDLHGDSIRSAKNATPAATRIEWVESDLFAYTPTEPVDVVMSSLMTHHLTDEQIVAFLAWMERTAQLGWFINDLHRKPVPYVAFKILSRLGGFHPFVQYDGPVSIRRSFLAEDWRRLCAAVQLPMELVSITEHRPARLCVGRIS